MAVDVPQWLSQAFVKSVQAAGSGMDRQALTQACTALYERWSSPDRHYHDKQHLIDTLTRIETLLPSTHSPDLVRLAAWYHGAIFSVEAKDVYTRNGGEDEHASAEFAEIELARLGAAPENAARVAALIRSLRSRESEASSRETAKFTAIDVDSLALRDAHLGCLAVEPQRYRRYVETVREEYGEVPDISFCRARRAIIHTLLHRRPLFITPLARGWEEAARANLEAEEERLVKKLKEMEALAPVNPRIPEPPLARDPIFEAPESRPMPTPPIPPLGPDGATTAFMDPVAERATPLAPTAESAPAPAPAKSTKPLSKTQEAREKLLRYSAEEDAAEQAQRQREAERRARMQPTEPHPTGILDTFSSMEAISERVEADRTPKAPAPNPGQRDESAERKRRRREEIAAEMRRRISERQRAAEADRAAGANSGELRRQGAPTAEFAPAAGVDTGELRRQGYSTGSIPAVRIEEEIASPVHSKAPAGAVHVAPTATSGPEAEDPAPLGGTPEAAAGPDDLAPSANTPEDLHRFEDSPGFGMEREPKDD